MNSPTCRLQPISPIGLRGAGARLRGLGLRGNKLLRRKCIIFNPMNKHNLYKTLGQIFAAAILLITCASLVFFTLYSHITLKYGWMLSCILGVVLTVAVLYGIICVIMLIWRIFTPEGRIAEREAQRRYDMKRWEKKYRRFRNGFRGDPHTHEAISLSEFRRRYPDRW